jgi:hypothetical protein
MVSVADCFRRCPAYRNKALDSTTRQELPWNRCVIVQLAKQPVPTLKDFTVPSCSQLLQVQGGGGEGEGGFHYSGVVEFQAADRGTGQLWAATTAMPQLLG